MKDEDQSYEQYMKGDFLKLLAKTLGSRGGKIGGKSKSKKKRKAAKLNGQKGGRPPKKETE